MSCQEDGTLIGRNLEKESAHALFTYFKDQLAENLKGVQLSLAGVRGVRIIPIVLVPAGEEDVAGYFTKHGVDTQVKVAVISLTDRAMPQVEAITLAGEDLYYGVVWLDMYVPGFECHNPLFVIKPTNGEKEYRVYVDYKKSVGQRLRFAKRADIPFGCPIGQREERIGNEGLLAFFWNPDREQNIIGSIVMPIGWEEKLKSAGMMSDRGEIRESFLRFGESNEGAKGMKARSAAEIRARLEAKYSWIIPHYLRWKGPQPDPSTQPEEYGRWQKSEKIVKCVFRLGDYWWGVSLLDDSDGLTAGEAESLLGDEDEPLRVLLILERLTTPIWERLNAMVERQRKLGIVESPTNAKQTLRAVKQLDERLTKRLEKDESDLGSDAELDELTSLREAGEGFSADGAHHVLTEAELAEIGRQIEELDKGLLVVDLLGEREILEAKRGRDLSLLPPHYRKKYES